MNAGTATKVRICGLVRSPDREGALAHFHPERGFALVARSSMSLTEVIDPTIWVREKIALAVAAPSEEPPLRRVLGALRAIHSELMSRSDRERSWVSVLVAVFHEGEGAAVLAGDCACYRYRDGTLARLGRAVEPIAGRAPTGALGTETQVRIEVVPLRPSAGDVYLLSTEPLPDGELARLSRELVTARDEATLLRRSLEGAPEKGRVAILVYSGTQDPVAAAEEGTRAEALTDLGPGEVDAAVAPLSLERIDADLHRAPSPTPPVSLERMPEAAPSEEWAGSHEPASGLPRVIEPASADGGGGEEEAAVPGSGADLRQEPPEPVGTGAPSRSRRRPLASPEEERPWHEPLALWGAGALAIVALAILVRSIVPGLLGDRAERAPARSPAPAPAGTVDLYSEPPGATIRVDGVPIERKTPAVGLALQPGLHRVELDWGPYGAWLDTVEVALGERIVLNPRVQGRATFRSSEPTRLLDVYVDGSYVGSTPLTLERLPVGRHLVRFGAPGATASAQEFELYHDTPLEIVGNAGAPPDPGSLTVRTALLTDEGFRTGKGDPVWIDGNLKGVTPLTLSLPPGMHSVRVVRRGYPAQVSVTEVKPGAEHFATAEFGALSEDPILFSAPLSVSASDPTPLTISLPESAPEDSSTVWLQAAPPGGSFQARRMMLLDSQQRSYAALVPPEVLGNATRKVSVYFRAVGASGKEVFSEVHTIPVKR
ncbi:MAG TPA: PEGA domain-containing protein [Candidatus Eisenbacteria bacterium]|jgi:hypothetical protein